jgi:hypothetical protein
MAAAGTAVGMKAARSTFLAATRQHSGSATTDGLSAIGCYVKAARHAPNARPPATSYPDQWLTFDRKGVQWRERYCDHCMQVEHDPPFEQLKVLSDAAQVLDGVQLEGGES